MLIFFLSFLIFTSSVMHLVIFFSLLVFIMLFYMLKMNLLSMMLLVLMALIYLGGVSVLISYICCVLPNFSFKFPKMLFSMVLLILLFLNLNFSNILILPMSYLFFFYCNSFWLFFICGLLLMGLISSNYVNYPKGSLRSV